MNKFEVIEKFFPECITEKNFNGELKKAVDFELLKNILTDEISDERESYNFNWVGKNNARIEAYRKIDKTLRPCIDESENFFTTENLYIEGDNLDVLKLLQQSYLHKIKMIYIDPPYNTGKDFIYKDNFEMDAEKYAEAVELYDDEGNLNFAENTMTNPRFHSDWCSMIYSRLILARNLLTEDGVIFISIDDNEQANLKKICDEVFGERNFVGEIIRKTKSMTGDNGCGFNLQHESLLIYAKEIDKVFLRGNEKVFEGYENPDNDPNGDWCNADPSAKSGGKSTYFEIENPYTHKKDFPPLGRYWAFSKETLQKYIDIGKIKFKKSYKDNERGFIFKRYKKDVKNIFEPVHSLFATENVYMNQAATIELKKFFDDNLFNYPKPIIFMKNLIKFATEKDSIVLDFFSGSATTAHAVMQLNAEDKGSRKFIMVQLPEVCNEKTEAFKAGYKNICEIGKERIRRAGKKISTGDIGFRVLKVDSSNFRKVAFKPSELTQEMILDLAENIKSDRTALDLLFGSLTDLGVELNLSLTEENYKGAKIYRYDENILACFNEKIELEIFEHMAGEKPRIAIFRDNCFIDDAEKINAEEIFKMISPDTKFKVL